MISQISAAGPEVLPSSIPRQLAATSMRIFARWVERLLNVSVQRPHDADPREHRRAARRRDQDQRFHRRLPFGGLMLRLRQLCDEVAGIFQGNEMAAARERDWIVK